LCYMLSRAKKYTSEFLDFTCICIGQNIIQSLAQIFKDYK